MSVMQGYLPRSGAAIVIPTDVIRFFYAITTLVVLLGVGRELFIAMVGTETVLQDLRHFALDAERNVGAWYSSGLMVLICVCTFLNWQMERHRSDLFSYSWLLISVVFLFLSVDETAGFHEVVDVPLREAFELTGAFYNPWIFFGAAFVVVFAAVLVPFLFSLPRTIAVLFVVSGAIYVGGALGLEPFDAYFENTYGEGSVFQVISTTIEETLEMIGLTLFLHANLIYMADTRTTLLLRR